MRTGKRREYSVVAARAFHRLGFVVVVLLAPIGFAGCHHRTSSATGPRPGNASAAVQFRETYAQLNDIMMYYKISGEGEPILFLHGGFGSSDTWADYFPLLGQDHLLIAPDSRGQGR